MDIIQKMEHSEQLVSSQILAREALTPNFFQYIYVFWYNKEDKCSGLMKAANVIRDRTPAIFVI